MLQDNSLIFVLFQKVLLAWPVPGSAEHFSADLVIDSQKLSYYNQLPAWKRFTWPNDTEAPGASLSWISTQAGTRQFADLPGAWGLIRLLDKASVTPYQGVSSSFNITWKAPDNRLLNYTLRTEAGEGPLALLRLRDFTLPVQIFQVQAASLAPAEKPFDPDAIAEEASGNGLYELPHR